MVCQQCGTEIADKALICYRCGTSTERPAAGKSSPRRVRGRLDVSLAALALLMLAGVFMGQVATDTVPPWVSWTLAVLAAVLVIWWLARRGAK